MRRTRPPWRCGTLLRHTPTSGRFRSNTDDQWLTLMVLKDGQHDRHCNPLNSPTKKFYVHLRSQLHEILIHLRYALLLPWHISDPGHLQGRFGCWRFMSGDMASRRQWHLLGTWQHCSAVWVAGRHVRGAIAGMGGIMNDEFMTEPGSNTCK
eukprot:366301-Chlamydomonas_euryale.AAC.63